MVKVLNCDTHTHTCKFTSLDGIFGVPYGRTVGLDIMSEQGPMIAQVSAGSDGGGCQWYVPLASCWDILVSQTYPWSCDR